MQRQCPSCLKSTDEPLCDACGISTFRLTGIDPIAAARLEIGQVVCERYRVVRAIGRGGMGAVYEARHVATGQPVALKLLALGADDGQEALLRFAREARVTASLRHANTVRLYDFGQTEVGALFMAMELLDGASLQALLEDRIARGAAFSDVEAISVGVEILRSLGEAHGAGLVHRDLKPDNVMLARHGDDEPILKVLDFGIARSEHSRVTGTSRLVGTPLYMSPEQCQGLPVDARSDLYALGVLLFALVCGRTPFVGEVVAVIRAHCDVEAPDVRDDARSPVSDEFAEVVRRALAKDPAERYESAAVMRVALETCLPPGMIRSLAWVAPMLQERAERQPLVRTLEPSIDDRSLVENAPTMADPRTARPARALPDEAAVARSTRRPWLWLGLGAVGAVAVYVAMQGAAMTPGTTKEAAVPTVAARPDATPIAAAAPIAAPPVAAPTSAPVAAAEAAAVVAPSAATPSVAGPDTPAAGETAPGPPEPGATDPGDSTTRRTHTARGKRKAGPRFEEIR